MDGSRPAKPSGASSTKSDSAVVDNTRSTPGEIEGPIVDANPDDSDLDEEESPESKRSETAQLWLKWRCVCRRGRTHEEGTLCPKATTYRTKGEGHLTMSNAKWAIRVLYLTSPRLVEYFWADTGTGMLIWFFGQLLSGTLPAWRTWSNSRMMDLVQRALKSERIPLSVILRTAAASLFFQCADDIYKLLSRRNTANVMTLVNDRLERAYLSAQLSLSITSLSNPYMTLLLRDAGTFAGFHHRTSDSSPFSNLSKIVYMFSLVIDISSQFTLLLQTIVKSSKLIFSIRSVGLLFLSLAPGTLKALTNWILARKPLPKGAWVPHLSDDEIRWMAEKPEFRQEVVLFGLKEWVLQQWDHARALRRTDLKRPISSADILSLGSTFAQYSFVDLYNVLITLGFLSTNLSLGSIRLYRTTSNQIYVKLRHLYSNLAITLQAIFQFAAFCEATSNVENRERRLQRPNQAKDAPLLSYEDVRQDGGMRIEAIDLGYTYPASPLSTIKGLRQSPTPILRGVNLIVEPGESLAIVGFNGAGKTTLVKVLMGLYRPTGTLLINGRSIDEYDPTTLHKRTSCLFQDFQQYHMTLRQNVGLGNIDAMHDDGRMDLAARRGGLIPVMENMTARLVEMRKARQAVSKQLKRQDQAVKKRALPKRASDPASPPNLWTRIWPMLKHLMYLMTHIEAIPARLLGTQLRIRSRRKKTAIPKPPKEDHWVPRPAWERYPDLSGGQWQKVALSRAFLRSDEADLIVFDEPSANLDPRAEADLFQRIHALSTEVGRKVTTIYISHRFSTVRKADKIAVVEEGTVKESGTHDELMALGGRYYELYKLSKEGFDDPGSSANGTLTSTSPVSPASPITPTTPVEAVNADLAADITPTMLSKMTQTEADLRQE